MDRIEDPRDPRRVGHPPVEAPLLIVCGAIAACDDCGPIAVCGATHVAFALLSALLDRGLIHVAGLNLGKVMAVELQHPPMIRRSQDGDPSRHSNPLPAMHGTAANCDSVSAPAMSGESNPIIVCKLYAANGDNKISIHLPLWTNAILRRAPSPPLTISPPTPVHSLVFHMLQLSSQ